MRTVTPTTYGMGTSHERHDLADVLGGPAEPLTVTESAELPVAAADAWAVLTDPTTAAHLGTWPLVAAFDLPGPPRGEVGARRCAAYRLPDGRLQGTLAEVVEVDPGRRIVDRALTSPFPMTTVMTVEPTGSGCRVRLTESGAAPVALAQRIADEWVAGLRHMMWRVRHDVGDPGAATLPKPVLTDDEQAWLDQVCGVTGPEVTVRRVAVTARRAADVAAPRESVWRLLAAPDSPVVSSADAEARRYAVTAPDATPSSDGALHLLATVRRCSTRADHVHVDFDEVVEEVAPERLVLASRRGAHSATTAFTLTDAPGGCRVDAETTHEVPEPVAEGSADRLGEALEGYLATVARFARAAG